MAVVLKENDCFFSTPKIGHDHYDAYSGASTNGELCVYSDYSASGESADTDSVKYYPLVAHASYAPQNRVGVNTHSDYLTS